jgi:phage FluMu gp28-like protein
LPPRAAKISELFPLLALPQLRRVSIDSTGMGTQLSERARQRFGWKAEGLNFTQPLKEQLAFALRAAFEERKLRVVRDDQLRSDLRGLKKQVTTTGKIQFEGETDDSHCDPTWALALCLHAASRRISAGGLIC